MATIICQACGKEKSGVRPADIKRGWAKTCSKSCAARLRERRLDRNGIHGAPKANRRSSEGLNFITLEYEEEPDQCWDAHKGRF